MGHRLSGEQLEDALRRMFDALQPPEIVVIPLELLAEIRRRLDKEEAKATGP